MLRYEDGDAIVVIGGIEKSGMEVMLQRSWSLQPWFVSESVRRLKGF